MITLLPLPLVYNIFRLPKVGELFGDIQYTTEPVFSRHGWFEGTYQEQFEKFANENFGFRNFFVRLNNQIYFSLFKIPKARTAVIGKDLCLYERGYIKAVYGQDYVGEAEIKKKITQFKTVQDLLKKKNIDLILVFAPGKGSFFPEFIPDSLKSKPDTTNLSQYLRFAKEMNINYIDFNTYFIQQKNISPYPLYSKLGMHWSYYGFTLSMDSMVHYIEKLRTIDLPDIAFSNPELSNIPKFYDNDIEQGLNLLFPVDGNYPLAYPEIFYTINATKIKPKALFVADSYYWGIFNSGMPGNVFADTKFWYYNNEIFPDNYTKPTNVNTIDFKSEILKQDAIVVLSTDANLPKLGWGFIERAYDTFTGAGFENKYDDEEIKSSEELIRSDTNTMASLKQKALENKIPLDSMIKINAIWMIDQKRKK